MAAMEQDEDLYDADVTQTSPFCRLPHELLVTVAKRLSLEDLRNLRLTNRQTASVLRVLLAQEDFAGVPWRDNAARLSALSALPECAQQIRRVRIRSRAVYSDEEQQALDDTLPNPEPPLWDLVPDGPTARRLAAHPEEKRIVPLRADVLGEALCRLRELEELELSWERFPFMSRADLGLDLELETPGEDAELDSELAEQLEYTTGGWQVEMLVDLASDMKALKALKMAPLALDMMDQASYLPLIGNLFHYLERLDLTLTAQAQRDDPSLLSKLEDVLDSAWSLQSLRLDLDNGGLGSEHRLSEDFLPKTTFKKLERLTLVGCVVRLRQLQALLKRHVGVLKEVTLRDMTGVPAPSQGSFFTGVPLMRWEELFKLIRWDAGGDMRRVRLRGKFADHVAMVRFAEVPGDEDHGCDGGMSEVRGVAKVEEDEDEMQDPELVERFIMGEGLDIPRLKWKSNALAD